MQPIVIDRVHVGVSVLACRVGHARAFVICMQACELFILIITFLSASHWSCACLLASPRAFQKKETAAFRSPPSSAHLHRPKLLPQILLLQARDTSSAAPAPQFLLQCCVTDRSGGAHFAETLDHAGAESHAGRHDPAGLCPTWRHLLGDHPGVDGLHSNPAFG